jgi:7,8-dihydroneopterin aldolase/epimerase/oxygenase
MDKIFIHKLETEVIVGIFDWERQVKQTVVFDFEVSADVRRAAASDSIDDTLNYKRVAKRVLEYVSTTQFHLVETLAESVAMLILEEFGVEWLRLTLNKPGALRFSRDVGVIIERTRKDFDDWRLRRAGK